MRDHEVEENPAGLGAGAKQIAARLLKSMIYEMRLRKLSLKDFSGGEVYGEEKEKKEGVEL